VTGLFVGRGRSDDVPAPWSDDVPVQWRAVATQLNRALLEASEGGKYPILSDTSPCSWRCKESPDLIDSRLKVR
jgi:hypothetical protein